MQQSCNSPRKCRIIRGGGGAADRESKEQVNIGKGQMQRKQGAPGL